MTKDQKFAYNKESSDLYGWTPQWFGCTTFDDSLLYAIVDFQEEYGLMADGLVGKNTFRKIYTVHHQDETQPIKVCGEGEKYIICNGKKELIKWDKVILCNEENGYETPNYKKYEGKRKVDLFICHWDATLSSYYCQKILNDRQLSVHFSIDNDGTIFQFVPDTDLICWHAKDFNTRSIGVEISNAYDLKWNDWYSKNGFGKRPIMQNIVCHDSTLPDFLGFYPIQLDALTALFEVIHRVYDIPLVSPQNPTGVDSDVVNGSFRGFCSHYHTTDRKIDSSSLSISDICKKAITLNVQD